MFMRNSSARLYYCLPYLPSFCGNYRIFRESAEFRNGYKIAATKVSAGVSTEIGDHESKYNGKETDEKADGSLK